MNARRTIPRCTPHANSPCNPRRPEQAHRLSSQGFFFFFGCQYIPEASGWPLFFPGGLLRAAIITGRVLRAKPRAHRARTAARAPSGADDESLFRAGPGGVGVARSPCGTGDDSRDQGSERCPVLRWPQNISVVVDLARGEGAQALIRGTSWGGAESDTGICVG